MWQTQLTHRGDGSQAGREILAGLVHEGAVRAVHGAQVEARVGDGLGEPRHHVKVRVQLYLPWAVEQEEGVVSELVELVQQFLNMLYQVLHAVDKTTVGPEVHQLLHIIQRDHVPDVQIASILEDLCCRIQIDDLEVPVHHVRTVLQHVAEC